MSKKAVPRKTPAKPEDYPRLIRVKDAIYHVIFIDQLPENVLGMCDQGNKIIFILKGEDPHETHCTFWHEVLHAFEEEYKMPLGHPKIRRLEYMIAEILSQF